MVKEFLHALHFLTRLRIGKHPEYEAELASAAVAWYALVGLLIGILLAISGWIFAAALDLPDYLSAALLLTLWVMITGALHLDGLGDCADAWMGGGSANRMLEIMKDSACGIGAIVALLLVLLLKFTALVSLQGGGDYWLLIVAPLAARFSLSLTVYLVPYVRSSGLGSRLGLNLDLKAIVIGGILISLLMLVISPAVYFAAIGASLAAFALIYFCFIKPLNGATGDIYGALVETTEAAVLVGLVVLR